MCVHFTAAAQQILYVQSTKAKMMASPAFDAEIIGLLQKGESVTLLKDQGRWVQVDFQSTTGWISKLLLAAQPPMEKISVLTGKQEQLENSARRRASTTTTAAATRGLRNEQRARMSDDQKPDYNELQQMEAVEVKEAEVWKFHTEGLSR